MSRPEEDVDSVEYAQKNESPSDRIDYNLFTSFGELEEHGTEQQEVYERPDPECHGCGSEICLLLRRVHVVGSSYGVDIGSEGEEEDHDIGELLSGVCPDSEVEEGDIP